MKLYHTNSFFFLAIVVLLCACSDDESGAKQIISFSISGTEASINQSDKTVALIIEGTELTNLSPTILISEGAEINPASGTAQDFTNPVIYTVKAEDGSTAEYTVNVESNTVPFTHEGKNYEIIKSKKSWTDAAAYAVSRGGYLVEINDISEQGAIYSKLQGASIDLSKTTASDGGGASYVWIGGNDLSSEGRWIWDGDNDQIGIQFWQGSFAGDPVDGLYNNWGNEPDNFSPGQDGLGLALTDWPMGTAREWNDLDVDNGLYFVIEFD